MFKSICMSFSVVSFFNTILSFLEVWIAVLLSSAPFGSGFLLKSFAMKLILWNTRVCENNKSKCVLKFFFKFIIQFRRQQESILTYFSLALCGVPRMILDVLLLTPLVIEDILMMRVDFKLSVIVALKGGFSFSLKLCLIARRFVRYLSSLV